MSARMNGVDMLQSLTGYDELAIEQNFGKSWVELANNNNVAITRALVFVDNRGVDGAVSALAAGIGGLGGRMRRLQTGYVRSYALTMLGGTVVVLILLLGVLLETPR